MPVEFVGGLRVSDADDRRDREDGPRRQGQQGHRPAPEPPRAAGGRPVAATTARCSASRAQAAPGGEDIGFVGRIERVDVDVLDHIAQDYIPVIASVGADREGNSYNVNADEAAGAVARALGAYKVIFLTDVRGLAARPERPGSRRSPRRGADEVEAALDGIVGRHAPEARRPASTRSTAACSSAHIVDGRVPHSLLLELFTDAGHRHEDPPGRVSVAELQASSASTSCPTYARFPVEFVRGEGARLWDADGNEYLDFLSGISVSTASGTATRASSPRSRSRPARLMHVGNLFYTEPAMRAGRAAGRRRSLGGSVSSPTRAPRRSRRRSSSRARRKPGGTIVVVHGGFHGRTYGALSATPQEAKQAPFAPLVPGFVAVAPTAEAIAARRRRADRRGPARAHPGRERRPRRSTTSCCAPRARPATSTARR